MNHYLQCPALRIEALELRHGGQVHGHALLAHAGPQLRIVDLAIDSLEEREWRLRYSFSGSLGAAATGRGRDRRRILPAVPATRLFRRRLSRARMVGRVLCRSRQPHPFRGRGGGKPPGGRRSLGDGSGLTLLVLNAGWVARPRAIADRAGRRCCNRRGGLETARKSGDPPPVSRRSPHRDRHGIRAALKSDGQRNVVPRLHQRRDQRVDLI